MFMCQMRSGLDTLKRKDGGALARAISAASRAEVTISTVSKHELNDLVGNRPHQASPTASMSANLRPCPSGQISAALLRRSRLEIAVSREHVLDSLSWRPHCFACKLAKCVSYLCLAQHISCTLQTIQKQ